jgi:hypothetical protein
MRWPEDPLRSKFALSVLAAHRSSLLIIQGLSRLHEQLSDLVRRMAFLYLHAFSAYVRSIPVDRSHATNKPYPGLSLCDRDSESRMCARSLVFGRNRSGEGTVRPRQDVSSHEGHGGLILIQYTDE